MCCMQYISFILSLSCVTQNIKFSGIVYDNGDGGSHSCHSGAVCIFDHKITSGQYLKNKHISITKLYSEMFLSHTACW